MSLDGEQLWKTFSQRLRSFISKRVNNPADVDDILQNVFLNLHRRLDAIEREEQIGAWMYRATRNAVVDHYRAAGRYTELAEEENLPASLEEDDPAVHAARCDFAQCLSPMLERLPPLYREAISLTDLGGATMAEASKRLGVSVSGVKARTQRGRSRLREMLDVCCQLEFDARGRLIDYAERLGSPCARPESRSCDDC